MKNSTPDIQSKTNAGFSLMEILVVIGIATLLASAVYTFQKNIFSTKRIFTARLTSQSEVRKAFKTMTAELRTASPGSTGAYPISQAGTSTLTFYSNIDSDPLKERIRYFLSGSTLRRGVIKPSGNPLTYNPSQEIVSDVIHDVPLGSGAIFLYYDSSYNGTNAALPEPVTLAMIRLVKITVPITSASSALSPATLFTTQVSLRNLKDNL